MHVVLSGLLLGLLAVVGCEGGNGKPRGADGSSVPRASPERAFQAGAAGAPDARPAKKDEARKIIATATVDVLVKDLDAARKSLLEFVESKNGYVAKSEITGDAGSRRTGVWTVRILPEHLQPLIELCISLGVPQRNALDTQDVTEEYVDVEARIKNKREEEKRLNELLQKAANKLDEVLLVEKEITRVRGEIESAQARLNSLTRLTELSTAHVTLTENESYVPPTTPDPPTFGNEVQTTFGKSLDLFLGFWRGLAIIVVGSVPWLVVVVPAIYLLRRFRGHRPKAEPTPPVTPPAAG